MESESDYDCGCWNSGSESELESEPESQPSAVSDRPQERWETVASAANSADRYSRMEALAAVLPHLPNCPQATALERALLHSNDLPSVLRAVEKAAWAMARAEELVAECHQV